jgi:hypothetical protein
LLLHRIMRAFRRYNIGAGRNIAPCVDLYMGVLWLRPEELKAGLRQVGPREDHLNLTRDGSSANNHQLAAA